MAIDTRDKRSSAINVGSPWRSMLPTPAGSITQADRQHIVFLYRGIVATGGEEETISGGEYQIIFRRRRRGR